MRTGWLAATSRFLTLSGRKIPVVLGPAQQGRQSPFNA